LCGEESLSTAVGVVLFDVTDSIDVAVVIIGFCTAIDV
jgi:hypothetical protein